MKVLIIEDESNSAKVLNNMLNEFCKGTDVVGIARDVPNAVSLIKEKNPDLILLDIEMPGQNGFAIFDYLPKPKFEVIFTTAYSEYALKALKLSAIDYLLKPIDLNELRAAIKKVETRKKLLDATNRINVLKNNLTSLGQKLALPTGDGYEFIELSKVMRCEAQGNYTMFYMLGKRKVMVCRTLKTYENLLSEFSFYRIGRSNIINLSFVVKFGRQKYPTVTMIDGTSLSLSIHKKEEFLGMIETLHIITE